MSGCRGSRAHPRVRGDVTGDRPVPCLFVGSPPRARGRRSRCRGSSRLVWAHPRVRGDVPYHVGDHRDRGGLTPACAGTSHARYRPPKCVRAHPRVRGDVSKGIYASGPASGSPPRARGRRAGGGADGVDRGLTPACAGTSGSRGKPGFHRWAHPRVRGDVSGRYLAPMSARGSPPRARGRHRPRVPVGAQPRAHPRVRGDVARSRVRHGRGGGSPPRARGRQVQAIHRELCRGLTPACAGTSPSPIPCGSSCGAHPRVRGDVVDKRQPRSGLSGLTPACAGTSSGGWTRATLHRAHPRVRGDVPIVMPSNGATMGSPPRARGRPCARRARAHRPGLTPACAGTSSPTNWSLAVSGAHPRVRGDVRGSNLDAQLQMGSPPRARGRHLPTRARTEYEESNPSQPACLTDLASPAPACPHRRLRLTSFRSADESYTIEINRLPVMSMNSEVQALIPPP